MSKWTFILLVFPFVITSCSKKPTIVHRGQCENILSSLKISDQSIIDFSEELFHSYQDTIKGKIRTYFLDSIYLTNSSGYSADFVISELSGIYVNFKPDTGKIINVYCTDLPCQLKCFYDYTRSDEAIRKDLASENLTYLTDPLFYSMIETFFVARGGWGTIYGIGTCVHPYPKLFSMGPTAFFIVDQITGVTENRKHTFKMGKCSFIFGGSDVTYFKTKTSSIVSAIARLRISELILSSPLFARSQANDSLRRLAENIRTRLQSNSSGDNYQGWELERDYNHLCETAIRLRVEVSYADSIFQDEKTKDKYGTLFWHHSSYWGFSLQWLLPNLIFLTMVVALRVFNKYNRLRKMLQWILGVLFISLNGWIFKNKPEGMEIDYWILPILAAMAVVILSFYWKIRLKNQ